MSIKNNPQPQKFLTQGELKDAMQALPLLRAPRVGLDPQQTVVVCHRSDLAEAIAFYQRQLKTLPVFYVLDLEYGQRKEYPAHIELHTFAELEPGMDIQIYTRQGRAAGSTPYSYLAVRLQQKMIIKFSIEKFCTENFFRRSSFRTYTDSDWDTILNFTNKLCDRESQTTYLAICRAALDSEPGYAPMADYRQYFHPKVPIVPGDIICEGGCYASSRNGKLVDSSTLHFLKALNGQGSITGFEPVAESFQELSNAFAQYEAIRLENKALWSHTGSILLQGSGASAFTNTASDQDGNCPCVSIDNYFAAIPRPTVIKLDVEGAEPEVLAGAKQTLAEALPKLMLSIYHSRQGMDWITVPRMLLESDLPYTYFCGHHRPWYSETIVYAIA